MSDSFIESVLAEIENKRSRIKELQTKIEENRNAALRLQIKDEELKSQLKEKFGISSWEEAKEVLTKIEAELIEKSKKLEYLLSKLENEN